MGSLRSRSETFTTLMIPLLVLTGCGAGTFGLIKALDQDDSDTFIPLSTASIDEAAVLLSRDRFRGIPIPYSVSPEGRVPADAIIQWRFDSDVAFPELPDEPDQIRAALLDPVEAARLQICTESPSAAVGAVGCLPAGLADDGRQVRIVGLGDLESWVLAEGIVGQEIQILRTTDAPVETTIRARGPRSIAPLGLGVTALVLDESSSGGFRIREIHLGTEEVIRTIVDSGDGRPNAMVPMGVHSVVVASHDGDTWSLRQIDLESGETLATLRAPQNVDNGDVRGLASLGGRALALTVGSSVLEVHLPESGTATGSDTIVHFDSLADPWGIAVDVKLGRKGVYVAESGADRVLVLDLFSRATRELATLESPMSLALDRDESLLLAITDEDTLAGLELRGIPLHKTAVSGSLPIDIRVGLQSQDAGIFVGPEALRLVTLRQTSQIALCGGIEQTHIVDAYDPQTQVATVDEDFKPALNVVQEPRRWRVLDRVRASVGTTRREVFIWNSDDAKTSGRVILGITPLDDRKGNTTEIRVGKSITSAIDVAGAEIENVNRDFFQDPRDLVAADMDNDGDPDLVVTAFLSDELLIVPQTDSGVFDTDSATSLSAGLSSPKRVDVADFNGDGLLDVVVSNDGAEEITVFLQQPGFVFTSTVLPISGIARSVVWANLNPLDDELELLIARVDASETSGDVLVLDPDGDDLGTIVTLSESTTRFPTRAMAADVDGDSRLDIVTIGCVDANRSFAPPGWDEVSQGLLEILFQDSGSFGFSQQSALDLGPSSNGPARPFALGIEDVDGDRDYDIAVGVATGLPSTDRIRVFLNDDGFDSDRVFDFEGPGINGPTAVHMVDMNGDGTRDIVTSNFGGSRIQDPGGINVSFQPAEGFRTDENNVVVPDVPDTGLSETSLVNINLILPVDLNGDGRLDLVASSEQETFRSDSGPDTRPPSEGSVVAFLAQDSGDYRTTPEFFGVPGVLRNPTLAAGDFNGDGALDLVTANGSSTVGQEPEGGNNLTVFFQEFLGQIDPAADVILGEGDFGFPLQNPVDLVTTDLNGDGAQDLAVVSREGNNVAIYTQDEDGTFDPPMILQNETIGLIDPIAVAAGDYDCDGDFDLVVANAGVDGNVLVFPQTSPGEFCVNIGCGALVLDAPSPLDLAVADVTGDGRPDVIALTETDVRIFDLVGGAGAPTILNGGLMQPQSLAVGDLNRDGAIDLAISNAGNDAITVYFQGDFGTPRIITDPSMNGESFVAIADVNSDGTSDLVAANRQQEGTLTVIHQISNGVFANPVTIAHPALTLPRGILPVDLDRDSDMDLVVPINSNSGDGILIFFGGQ